MRTCESCSVAVCCRLLLCCLATVQCQNFLETDLSSLCCIVSAVHGLSLQLRCPEACLRNADQRMLQVDRHSCDCTDLVHEFQSHGIWCMAHGLCWLVPVCRPQASCCRHCRLSHVTRARAAAFLTRILGYIPAGLNDGQSLRTHPHDTGYPLSIAAWLQVQLAVCADFCAQAERAKR